MIIQIFKKSPHHFPAVFKRVKESPGVIEVPADTFTSFGKPGKPAVLIQSQKFSYRSVITGEIPQSHMGAGLPDTPVPLVVFVLITKLFHIRRAVKVSVDRCSVCMQLLSDFFCLDAVILADQSIYVTLNDVHIFQTLP